MSSVSGFGPGPDGCPPAKAPPCTALSQEAFAHFVDDRLAEHDRYVRQNGKDMPEIRNWRWTQE